MWEIAIDIGYSAVKLFSPNMVARFPSYAKRVDDNLSYIGKAPDYSVVYRDDVTGEIWLVGQKAQEIMSASDTSDSESSLYGRDRYGSSIFKVVSEAGLGVGMMKNEIGDPKSETIVVQTGLPDKYMNDEEYMRDVLAGHHQFSLKIGQSDWVSFDFDLKDENIYVMSQPKGTLFSVCIDRNGKFHPKAADYLSSSVIVFDPGFGTLDIFPINSGIVGSGETYDDLGMKRILSDTSKMIWEAYHTDIPVPAMQKYLATGKIVQVDRKKMISQEQPFGDFLADATFKVCDEAIQRLSAALPLSEYKYMIVTGGTGAAWFNHIKDRFKGFTTLDIIQGSQNDTLPFVFSNVRGYYFYRFNKLGSERR